MDTIPENNRPMKIKLIPFIFIFLTMACLPENYNFKENPVYILKEALDSLQKRDIEKFARVSGKEALCLYGNDSNLQTIADNFSYSEHDLKLDHKLISTQFNEPVKFVGFWSYKTDRHLFEISDKQNQRIMDVIIDCEFGNEGEKLKGEKQKDPKNYKIKQCRLIKITPVKFKGLAVTKKCESLKVNLGPL